jgi:hypothetical protein
MLMAMDDLPLPVTLLAFVPLLGLPLLLDVLESLVVAAVASWWSSRS